MKISYGGSSAASPDNVKLTGSIVSTLTDEVVVAATNIIDSDYTAPSSSRSQLMVSTDTGGILSLLVDGKASYLNSGAALSVGLWYAFEIPLVLNSTYNLQFSAGATMQVKWIVGV